MSSSFSSSIIDSKGNFIFSFFSLIQKVGSLGSFSNKLKFSFLLFSFSLKLLLISFFSSIFSSAFGVGVVSNKIFEIQLMKKINKEFEERLIKLKNRKEKKVKQKKKIMRVKMKNQIIIIVKRQKEEEVKKRKKMI